MAGIEKVCELTGDYPGHEMYRMKRNHIQVATKHRKHFRGHKATLYVFKRRFVISDGMCHWDANLKCINANPSEADWDSFDADRHVVFENGVKQVYSVFYDSLRQYKAALATRHQRLLMEYQYVLDVPSLAGEVDGLYMNWSTNMSSVIRRLKRLVGARNLTVKFKEENYYDFIDNLYEERGEVGY